MGQATSTSAQARPARTQRYSPWQRLRAVFYGRATLVFEALIGLALLLLVVLGDVIYFLGHGANGSLTQALLKTIGLLSLQGQEVSSSDSAGAALLVFNLLFSLLFLQSVLNTVRAALTKRDPRIRQLGLAATLGDHVIVCGVGRVGLRVLSRLVASGIRVTAIEREWESALVARALALGVPVVVGDARESQTLRNAGLAHACAVIACIDGDLLDVEIALSARAERPDIRVILRAFNEDFDRGLERSFGANSAFSTSALAAPTFAAATLSRDIEYVLRFAGVLYGVACLVVTDQVQQGGLTMRQLEERYNVRALHQQRGNVSMPDWPLIAGDTLTLLGALPALDAVRTAGLGERAGVADAPPLRQTAEQDTVIICGLGKVGYRVVRLLHAQSPRPRIVVVYREDEALSFAKHISQLNGVTVISGDARDAETLAQAGLDRAFAVAAITSDDLTNLQISLEARRLQPGVHVVLRVFSDTLAEKLVDLFGIHTTYSTSDLASPTLAAAAVLGDVSRAFFTEGRLYAMTHFAIYADHPLYGLSVAAIRKRYGATVLGLGQGGAQTALPSFSASVVTGDEVTLVAPLDVLARLRGR